MRIFMFCTLRDGLCLLQYPLLFVQYNSHLFHIEKYINVFLKAMCFRFFFLLEASRLRCKYRNGKRISRKFSNAMKMHHVFVFLLHVRFFRQEICLTTSNSLFEDLTVLNGNAYVQQRWQTWFTSGTCTDISGGRGSNQSKRASPK